MCIHNKMKTYCTSFKALSLLLLFAVASSCFASAESSFAVQELNRAVGSKMTPGQRNAYNMFNRYNRMKRQGAHAPAQAAPTQHKNTEGPVVSTVALPEMPVNIDCEKMLAHDAEKKYAGMEIVRVQQELLSLGFNPGSIDGRFGPNTRSAIAEYCTVDKAYHNWPLILESDDFEKWADKSRDPTKIEQDMLSGNSASLIALLDRYMRERSFAPVTWTGEFLVSYKLSEDDFKQLASQKDMFKRIAQLQNQAYVTEGEFDTALDDVLKGVPDPDRYKAIVERYVEPQSGVMLNMDSFNALKAGAIPDYVLQTIQDMNGLKYTRPRLEGEVDAHLSQLAEKTMGFEPEIVKLVRILPSGAHFTDDSLKQFSAAHGKDDLLANAILDRLQKMEKVIYQSDKTMALAVNNVLMQIVGQIKDSHQAIVDSAKDIPAYNLTDKSMEQIDKQLQQYIIPPVYMELLEGLQDVDYPEPHLLWKAIESKIFNVGFNNMLRRKIFGVIEMSNADRIDAAVLEKLKAQGVMPANLALIATLENKRFEDTKGLENAIDELYRQLKDNFEQYHSLVLAQARKVHMYDKTKKIVWSGDSCGCVHRNLSGTVYGFFPYWMAGGKKAVDFSMLNRVGYYGLGFNDKGEIADESRWSGLDTGFIRQARKYGTKVDLVIYRGDWKTWSLSSQDEITNAFNNLSDNIFKLVSIPLTNFFSDAKPYVSLGLTKHPIMGDGVTLYFEGYPDDPLSVEAFGNFIRNLSAKLKTLNRNVSINLMFRSSEIGSGIYDYYKLLGMMDTIRGDDLQGQFLVMLQEPTTFDKKKLRLNVENGLHGNNRMKLLRNINTVISYDGHDLYQLTDDSIYARDNFGGIGFWTMPIVQDEGKAVKSTVDINNVLGTHYLDYTGKDALGICKYICPNRWFFRILWGAFFFAMIALVLLRFVSCAWMTFFDKHFMYLLAGVVLPAIALTLALLFCDPAWYEISRGNSGLIILIMIGVGYSVWNYKDKKRKATLP